MNYQQAPNNSRANQERPNNGSGMLFLAILFLGFNTYLLFEMKQDVEHLRDVVAEMKGMTQQTARATPQQPTAPSDAERQIALSQLKARAARRTQDTSLPPPSQTEQLAGARSVPYFRMGELVGIRMFAVEPSGTCARAGLAGGDIITALDGKNIVDGKIKDQLDKLCGGRIARELTIERERKQMTLKIN